MRYDNNNQLIPETVEDYKEIYGYDILEELEKETSNTSVLNIEVIDVQEFEQDIDTSDIIRTRVINEGKENERNELTLNYAKYSNMFAKLNNLACCNGQFYTPDGRVSKSFLESEITVNLAEFDWSGKLDSPTNSILKTVGAISYVEELPVNDRIIPFKNGDLHLDNDGWKFHLNEKKQAAYRLSAKYVPTDKPKPLFDKWLNDLFYEEDIPTVQEILGYCLVPSTAVQEAFFFIGKGEEGKSIIGHILKEIMGNAYVAIDTKTLLGKSFQLSQLENRLVAYDDDMKSEALEETGLLKKIISADTPLQGEYKFADPYTFTSYAKVVACSNFMINSLHDTSHGFFRRLHPILVKPLGERKPVKNFHKLLLDNEKEQIVRWALEGLQRLIQNDWKIHWSSQSSNYMSNVVSGRVHFDDFIEEVFDNALDNGIHSTEYIRLYKAWCKLNAITPCKDRTLLKWLGDNEEKLGMEKSENIVMNNRRARGFNGKKIKPEWVQNTVVF